MRWLVVAFLMLSCDSPPRPDRSPDVYCTNGTRAIVVDQRVVGCQR